MGGCFFPQDPNGFLTFTYQCVVLKKLSKGCVKYRPFCVGGSFQSRVDRGSTRRHLLWLLADFFPFSAADVPERCWCYLAMRNQRGCSIPFGSFGCFLKSLNGLPNSGRSLHQSDLTRDKNRICRSSGFPATNVYAFLESEKLLSMVFHHPSETCLKSLRFYIWILPPLPAITAKRPRQDDLCGKNKEVGVTSQ